MRLLLIRHAQSSNNLLYQQQGSREGRLPDPPLSELGRQQAQALATWARHDPVFGEVAALYSSLTTRAVQTAAPLAEALRLRVQGLADAHETQGLYQKDEQGSKYAAPGRSYAELRGECPALLWPAELPEAEPWAGGFEPKDPAGYHARAGRVLAHLQAQHPASELVALITHGHFTQYLLWEVIGVRTESPVRFGILNTATTLLYLPAAPEPAAIDWVNRCPHLLPEQLSE